MMRVFSINHGYLNILYEYNSRTIKQWIYTSRKIKPLLGATEFSRSVLWEEVQGWLVSPETHSGPIALPAEAVTLLCPRAVHSLLLCTSSGVAGEGDPKAKETQALSEARPHLLAPDPTWFVSHDKEKKLRSSFLVIPSQQTYGPFKLWKIS